MTKGQATLLLLLSLPSVVMLIYAYAVERGDDHIAILALLSFCIYTSTYSIAEVSGWAAQYRKKILETCDAINLGKPYKVRWRSSIFNAIAMFILLLAGATFLYQYASEGGEKTFYGIAVLLIIISYHYVTEIVNYRELCIEEGKLKLGSGPLYSFFYSYLEHEYTSNSKLIFKKETYKSNKGVKGVYYKFYILNDDKERAIEISTANFDQARYIQGKIAGDLH